MGIFKRKKRSENRSVNVTEELLKAASVMTCAKAGISVTEYNALKYSAVYACVRVLAETVASLPLHVYRRLDNGGKEKASDYYLYDVLHLNPNSEQTSFEFRELMMVYLTLWGNAYAQISWDSITGRVTGLWPMRPDRMKIKRVDGQLEYTYQSETLGFFTFTPQNVLHIKGMSINGVTGLSPIGYAREAIGLGLAAEDFGSRFFANDARPGIVLEHPGRLSEQGYKRLKKDWVSKYGGLPNKHKVALLEEGIKVHEIGIPPEDAQFLETRKFQVNEIARIFRIPPHMIGDLERSTFSNIEQQSLEFVIHTIRPWLVRWEQALNKKLLVGDFQKEYFAEFLVDGLLRGDIKSRYEAYSIGRQNGWLSADDIRELENMNPLPDGMGKTYLIPLNMIQVNAPSQKIEKPDESKAKRDEGVETRREKRAAESRRKVANAFIPIYEAMASKVIKRESAEVKKAIRKHLMSRDITSFREWMRKFYDDHVSYMERVYKPVFITYREAIQKEVIDELSIKTSVDKQERFTEEYIKSHINQHINSSQGQIGAILRDSGDTAEDIAKRKDEWEDTRPNKIARLETVQFSNAIARETYRSVGIQRLQWVASAKSCPYCSSLDGRIVGIDTVFFGSGTSFHPEGASEPMAINHDIFHPPAHEGCQCQIMAV